MFSGHTEHDHIGDFSAMCQSGLRTRNTHDPGRRRARHRLGSLGDVQKEAYSSHFPGPDRLLQRQLRDSLCGESEAPWL